MGLEAQDDLPGILPILVSNPFDRCVTKQLGVAIPEQIMVTGFDGTAQSAAIEPSLTTVQIPGAEIGRIAADMLLSRIANPDRPPISDYMKTVAAEAAQMKPQASSVSSYAG